MTESEGIFTLIVGFGGALVGGGASIAAGILTEAHRARRDARRAARIVFDDLRKRAWSVGQAKWPDWQEGVDGDSALWQAHRDAFAALRKGEAFAIVGRAYDKLAFFRAIGNPRDYAGEDVLPGFYGSERQDLQSAVKDALRVTADLGRLDVTDADLDATFETGYYPSDTDWPPDE